MEEEIDYDRFTELVLKKGDSDCSDDQLKQFICEQLVKLSKSLEKEKSFEEASNYYGE